MKSVLVLLFLSVQILSAACPASTVQITGTLLNPDGSGFTGRLIPFLGYTIPTARENRVTFTATAGVLTASNNGGLLCLAPASYTVANYVGNSQLSYNTYWVVPSVAGPVTVTSVESTSIPTPSLFVAPSSITPGTNGQVLTTVSGAAAWAASAGGGGTWGTISGTLSSQLDLASALAAKQASLGYVPANVASNLSDLISPSTARTNLGLGTAAVLPGSTTVNGTVCTLGSTCTPSGVLPTGSGNQIIATPANGSSGVSALRSVVGPDVSPLTGQVTIGDESLIPPDIQGWWGSGRSYVLNTDATINGLSVESVGNSGKTAITAVAYANAAGQQANALAFSAYRASALAVPGAYGINGGIYTTASGTVAYAASLNNGFDGAGVVGTLSYDYYAGVSTDNGASVVTHYDFYSPDQGGKSVTNPYYSWFDSRGVRRVKEDATFNSVGQAIEALYNPQFTKYTPGATDFERIVLGQFNSNVAEIGTEAGGTGTQRDLRLLAPTVRVPGALTVTGAISGALTGNASTATALAANPTNCTAGNYPLGVDAGGNVEGCTAAATGNALTANPLSQFAATTSAQLAGVITNETGSSAGLVVFNDSPTIVTPTIASFTNATHTHANAAGGGTVAYTDLTSKPTIPTVTGGTCTSQAVTAISGSAVPTCATITSAYIDSSIAPTLSAAISGNWVLATAANNSLVIKDGASESGYRTQWQDSSGNIGAGFRTSTAFAAYGLETYSAATATAFGCCNWRSSTLSNIGVWTVASTGGYKISSKDGGGGGSSDGGGSPDIGLDRDAAGVFGITNGTNGTTAANYRDLKLRSMIGGSSPPTVATCGTIGTGSTNVAGFISSATTGACVSVLTFIGTTAPTGWSCGISNATTANLITQTGSSTTTATFTGTTVSGDVLRYVCAAY